MPPLTDSEILYLAVLQTAGFGIGAMFGLALRFITNAPVNRFKMWASGLFAAVMVIITLSAVVGAKGPLLVIFILLSLIIPFFGTYLIALPAFFFGIAALRR